MQTRRHRVVVARCTVDWMMNDHDESARTVLIEDVDLLGTRTLAVVAKAIASRARWS
jgi:hypothetical protein